MKTLGLVIVVTLLAASWLAARRGPVGRLAGRTAGTRRNHPLQPAQADHARP